MQSLHLNTQGTSFTQRCRTALTMLSRPSVGTCQGILLAEPPWTDTSLNSGIDAREVISTLEKEVQAGGEWYHHHHQSLNREGRWGTTDDFLQPVFSIFSLFSTALWDLPNSRPVHSLMLSSYLFLCLHSLLPPFTVPCKMVLARSDEREHDHTTAVCVSLRSSGGLRVV